MNGIIEKQGTPLNPPSCKTCKPTIMERRLAENCVAEIERLSEIHPYMASNLSRRARQLYGEGLVEKKRVGKIEYFRHNTHRTLNVREANNSIRSLNV